MNTEIKESKKEHRQRNLKSIVWAFKEAFKASPFVLISWTLLICIGALAPAFFISLSREVVDKMSAALEFGSNVSNLIGIIIVLAIFLFISEIYSIIPELLWAIMYPRYTTTMERKFIEKANRIPGFQYEQHKFSQLLDRACYNGYSVTRFVIRSLEIPASFIGMIAILITAAHTSIWLLIPGCIFMVWSIINGVLQGLTLEKMNTLTDEEYRFRYTFYEYGFNRNLTHEIRTLNAGWFLKKMWCKYSDPILQHNLNWNKENTKRIAFRSIAVRVGEISIYVMGLVLFLRHDPFMTIGSLTILPSLLDQIVTTTDGIGYKIFEPFQCLKAINDMREFFESDFGDDSQRLEKKLTPILDDENVFEMKHVYHRYAPDKPLTLEDVSFQVKKGEIVSLVGLNGAGKTTIIKLLLGFAKQESGEVLFNGRPIDEVTRYEYTQRVGAVFQSSYTYDMKLRENIGVAAIDKIDDDEAIMKAARLGGAEKIIDHAEHGLDNYVGKIFAEDGLDLSGGEMQRLSLARTQMIEKDIMLLDEPAAALDPIAELEQYERIRNRIIGHTAILVSHRISFSRLADRIIVIKDSKVVEQGTHDNLMAKNGFYTEMFNSQAQWYKGGDEN